MLIELWFAELYCQRSPISSALLLVFCSHLDSGGPGRKEESRRPLPGYQNARAVYRPGTSSTGLHNGHFPTPHNAPYLYQPKTRPSRPPTNSGESAGRVQSSPKEPKDDWLEYGCV